MIKTCNRWYHRCQKQRSLSLCAEKYGKFRLWLYGIIKLVQPANVYVHSHRLSIWICHDNMLPIGDVAITDQFACMFWFKINNLHCQKYQFDASIFRQYVALLAFIDLRWYTLQFTDSVIYLVVVWVNSTIRIFPIFFVNSTIWVSIMRLQFVILRERAFAKSANQRAFLTYRLTYLLTFWNQYVHIANREWT